MLVHFFCCCYHLRTGAIVLAWLQLMCNVVLLATAASPIPYMASILPDKDVYRYILGHVAAVILIGELLIKAVTCFALIWGVIQRNHFFLQPWLFIQFLENIVLSVLFLALFIIGCFFPIVFASVLPVLFLAVINWYFWICVKTVYNEDYKPSIDVWGEFTNTTSFIEYSNRNSFRQPQPQGFVPKQSRINEYNSTLPRIN